MHTRLFPLLALVAAAIGVAWPRAGHAQLLAQDHTYTRTEVEAGLRLYGLQCQVCHGPNGDVVQGIDLRLGRFRRVSSDEDLARLITNGLPGTGMPAFTLPQADLTSIVAFIRAGFDAGSVAVKVGDATRGRTVFDGKGKCAGCHRVNGRGPRTAPDLSEIGAIRTLAALQRVLLQPSESLIPINRPVRIVTKDGRTIAGRRLNEDTFTVQIIDDKERLLSLAKADLKQYTVDTKATMPSVQGVLAEGEIADVIAYLVSLKGL